MSETGMGRLGPASLGEMEQRVIRDLARLPDALRNGGLAGSALDIARMLDGGGLMPRDALDAHGKLRLVLVQIAEMTTGEGKGDSTDAARQAREDRMLRLVGGQDAGGSQ